MTANDQQLRGSGEAGVGPGLSRVGGASSSPVQEREQDAPATLRTPATKKWYANNPGAVMDFAKQMRRKVPYVIQPDHLWANIAKQEEYDSSTCYSQKSDAHISNRPKKTLFMSAGGENGGEREDLSQGE